MSLIVAECLADSSKHLVNLSELLDKLSQLFAHLTEVLGNVSAPP